MKRGFKTFLIYLLIPEVLKLIFSDFSKTYKISANLLFYFVLLLAFLFFSFKDLKDDFFDIKINFKKYFKIIIKWSIIGFCLMLLSNFIIGLFVSDLPINELSSREFLLKSPVLYLLYTLVVAPLLEEYVFRYSFKGIKNYYLFVILTSLVFASLHLLSIIQISHIWYIISYFLISFCFANVYYKCQNYFASTLAHVIHNMLCVIIILVF